MLGKARVAHQQRVKLACESLHSGHVGRLPLRLDTGRAANTRSHPHERRLLPLAQRGKQSSRQRNRYAGLHHRLHSSVCGSKFYDLSVRQPTGVKLLPRTEPFGA